MKPIADVPSEWRHFSASLAFTIVLPLVPLLIEAWYENRITAQSLTLATAIYAATIGVSSKNAVLLAITLVVSVVFAIAFGRIMGTGQVPDGCSAAALLSLAAITVVHVCERYIKHVAKGESFIQMPETR
ncbi:hypothetical protein [Haloferula sp.]|uniref:hypothetical protein n=1 Tax=Haloferula sp. TaxID=2497595 RepID=UPI0032A0C987